MVTTIADCEEKINQLLYIRQWLNDKIDGDLDYYHDLLDVLVQCQTLLHEERRKNEKENESKER